MFVKFIGMELSNSCVGLGEGNSIWYNGKDLWIFNAGQSILHACYQETSTFGIILLMTLKWENAAYSVLETLEILVCLWGKSAICFNVLMGNPLGSFLHIWSELQKTIWFWWNHICVCVCHQ